MVVVVCNFRDEFVDVIGAIFGAPAGQHALPFIGGIIRFQNLFLHLKNSTQNEYFVWQCPAAAQ